MIYLLPFLSYLGGSKSIPPDRLSDSDTMVTNTALETTVLSSGKNGLEFVTEFNSKVLQDEPSSSDNNNAVIDIRFV